jgi:hypothetical protein
MSIIPVPVLPAFVRSKVLSFVAVVVVLVLSIVFSLLLAKSCESLCFQSRLLCDEEEEEAFFVSTNHMVYIRYRYIQH